MPKKNGRNQKTETQATVKHIAVSPETKEAFEQLKGKLEVDFGFSVTMDAALKTMINYAQHYREG